MQYVAGDRQLQSFSGKVGAKATWSSRTNVMSLAGMACFQLASQEFSHAAKGFRAGLAAIRAGGIAETADAFVYHLCMDGLLACQALGQDHTTNGYSYEGFR